MSLCFTTGSTLVDLVALATTAGAYNESRSGESNLAELYCRALLAESSSEGITVCLMNGGGWKQNIPAGNITAADLSGTYPYNNT